MPTLESLQRSSCRVRARPARRRGRGRRRSAPVGRGAARGGPRFYDAMLVYGPPGADAPPPPASDLERRRAPDRLLERRERVRRPRRAVDEHGVVVARHRLPLRLAPRAPNPPSAASSTSRSPSTCVAPGRVRCSASSVGTSSPPRPPRRLVDDRHVRLERLRRRPREPRPKRAGRARARLRADAAGACPRDPRASCGSLTVSTRGGRRCSGAIGEPVMMSEAGRRTRPRDTACARLTGSAGDDRARRTRSCRRGSGGCGRGCPTGEAPVALPRSCHSASRTRYWTMVRRTGADARCQIVAVSLQLGPPAFCIRAVTASRPGQSGAVRRILRE